MAGGEQKVGLAGPRVTNLDGLLHVPITQGHQWHRERLPHRVQSVLDHLGGREEQNAHRLISTH